MIRYALLAISILISLATAFLSASLLDYNIIEPYIYAVTYFDPGDGYSHIFFALLFAPLPLAAALLWQRGANRGDNPRAKKG